MSALKLKLISFRSFSIFDLHTFDPLDIFATEFLSVATSRRSRTAEKHTFTRLNSKDFPR